MESEKGKSLDYLLNHPKTGHVTADVNAETLNRRSFSPRKIKIFLSRYTRLEDCLEYQFCNDKEALNTLPDIIDNTVQRLVPEDGNQETRCQAFNRQRNIGVIFSGGPAPGGHNVIAGLYDEAKKYHPDSRVFGFLLGPDGLLESKYLEITGSLVDAHRNMGGFSMINTGRTKIDCKHKMEFLLLIKSLRGF